MSPESCQAKKGWWYNVLRTIGLLGAAVFLLQNPARGDYPLTYIPIGAVKLTDSFWLPRVQQIQTVTFPHCLDTCIKEGRLENFLIAGKKSEGPLRGKMPFEDTDIYKLIEGAAYSLLTLPNPQLAALLDSLIAIIQIGQEPDGYLTTWMAIDSTNPPAWWVPKSGGRWARLASSHELYNCGHLFESAVAHYQATGKRNLLDIALKNADLLVRTFGYGKLTLPPGHQIVETGLIRLYRVTGNENYLRLARFFLDIRGDSTSHQLYGTYAQDHRPVVQQSEIVGHAVRAVYMYAGMTDIAVLYDDKAYRQVIESIWQDMVTKKMYLTGGIGARHEGESIGAAYELPNLTGYNETCAAIGNVLWNARLLQLTGDGRYADLIERILYNGLIAGISLDGRKFFYVNPLEFDGKFKFNVGSVGRQPWFICACCPTNLVRFIPAIPGLIYMVADDTLYVNLFIGNRSQITVRNQKISVELQENFPWDDKVIIKVRPERKVRLTVKVRIPGWARNTVLFGDLYRYVDRDNTPARILIDGREVSYHLDRGYATITGTWSKETEITLALPLKARWVTAHEKVIADRDHVALTYGPLVYCLEETDNAGIIDKLMIDPDAALQTELRRDWLGGIKIITGKGYMGGRDGAVHFTAIPYYAWANRDSGKMKVWIPKTSE